MAVVNVQVVDTYDELLSTTLRNYQPKLVDQVSRGLPLLYWLNSKDRKRIVDGGYQIVVPLIYGFNNTVQTYSGYDTVSVTPQTGITSAIYDWKSMAVSISINREEERKNSGAHRLVSLLEAKTQQAEKSMMWVLSDMIHGRHGALAKTQVGSDINTVDSVGGTAVDANDGSSKNFTSLDHLVRMPWGYMTPASGATCTHTVGRIEVKTGFTVANTAYADFNGTLTTTLEQNTWWLNYSNPGFQRSVRDTTNDTLKLGSICSQAELEWAGEILGNSGQNLISAMREMYNRLSSEGDNPDLILSGQEVFGAYEGALVPLERFTDMKLGDAGFQNLRFKNATMMMDHGITTPLPMTAPTESAPATPLYLLNSKYLEWTVDAQSDFAATPFYRPANQIARTAQILLMAQLTTSNRSKHGVIACANYANGYGTA